ncbi:MAG: GAF domain-containing protein, partial [Desulfobacterales bacterium]|nr:GAF domain-containing protein [Desulfobacterales bacterium]
RDITSDSRRSGGQKGKFERERYRVLNVVKHQKPEDVVLRQNELSELLPRPTRLSLNIMQRLWEPGGTVDLACGALGIPYLVEEDSPSYVDTAFGSLYVNCFEEKKRTSKGVNTLTAFRMSRAGEAIEQEFKEDFLPAFLQDMRLRDAVEFGRLPIEELIRLFHQWERSFVTRDYFQAEMINVAAEYYMRMAKTEITRRGEDPARYLGDVPETIVHRAMSLLPMIRQGKRDIYDFLDIFGHRAPQDFELSMPRYRENIEEVMKMVSRAKGNGDAGKEAKEALEITNKTLALTVDRARRFQMLKEEAKHHCLREIALLRRLLLELDSRLELEGGIFHLDVDEVLRLGDSNFTTRAFDVIENRRNESFDEDLEQPPIDFKLTDLERYGLNLDLDVGDAAEATILRGIRISGVGEGYGQVRVLTKPEDIDVFEKGEILVTRFTDPTWTPLFSLASGVITEVGGWLSHAAIVAREMNLVGIVNVRDATRVLKTGDFVRLHIDGTVEIDTKARREGVRFEANRVLTIQVADQKIDARLLEVGHTSALFEMEAAIFNWIETDATGSARLEAGEEAVGFTVLDKTEANFKVEFEKTLDTRTVDFLKQDRSVVFDKIEKARAEKTQLLSKVTDIKSEINIRPLCQKAMNAITELLQADRSTLFLYDDKTDELWSIAAEGADSKEIRFPSEFGIAGSVFTSGETVNIEDAYEDSRFNPEVDKKTNYRTESILCMPVKGAERNVGVIQVLNKKGGPFTSMDEKLLEDFASQALVALENALQYDEVVTKTQLLAAASELQSETDLMQLLEKTMAGAKEFLKARRCTIFLYDENAHELWTVLLEEGEQIEVRFPAHIGLVGASFETREKINIEDAYTDPRFNPQVDQKTNFRTRTVLCMPLRRDGKCMGVIQAVNKKDGRFTAVDEDRLENFAEAAMLAFENAQLVSEASRIRDFSDSVLENVSDGVIIVGPNNRIETCNVHVSAIFKQDADALVERRIDAAFEGANQWVMENIEKAHKSKSNVNATGETLTLSNGETVPVDLGAIPLFDGKGDLNGSVLIFSESGTA